MCIFKSANSMDKLKIVTCTAPVNIAVIKYCKYPFYVALYGNLNVRYVASLIKVTVNLCNAQYTCFWYGDLCFMSLLIQGVHGWLSVDHIDTTSLYQSDNNTSVKANIVFEIHF